MSNSADRDDGDNASTSLLAAHPRQVADPSDIEFDFYGAEQWITPIYLE
jgi:hypothetical protein